MGVIWNYVIMLYKEKWFSFFFAFDIRPFIICIPLFFFSTYLEVIKVFYFQNNNGLIVSSDYKDIAYLVWKNLSVQKVKSNTMVSNLSFKSNHC